VKDRICIITYESLQHWGGLVVSQLRVAKLLGEAGYEVHLVRLSSNTTPAEWEKNSASLRSLDGYDVQAFEITPWLCPPGTTYADHEIVDALERLDERYNYALFHGFGLYQNSFLTCQAAKRKPVILSGRGSDINRGRFRMSQAADLQWMLTRADGLTFSSQTMLERAEILAPCRSRSVVIHNSIDETQFQNTSAVPDFSHAEGETILCSSGHFGLKKGADLIAEAVRILREQNILIRLLWVGAPDGEDSPSGRFASTIGELRSKRYLSLTGSVAHDQVLNYLKFGQIFVLASIDEGCPNALLEAMLAQHAVIAVRAGAIPEIIRDGVDGLLISPYDLDALVQAIKTLVEQPELRVSLGQAACQRVKTFCSPEKEKLAWMNIYERVLSKKGLVQKEI